MTTLDDAAERRCREIAIELMKNRKWDTAFPDAIRATWKEATEAAAKKCEVKIKREAGFGGRWEGYGAFDDWMIGPECAAAIRGKP